jgi:hypothetical protein
VSVRRFTPVANNLESADHLTDGEEANHLSGDNTNLLEGSRVHVPYASKERLRVLGRGCAVEECGRVLNSLGHGLEVCLNGLHSTL